MRKVPVWIAAWALLASGTGIAGNEIVFSAGPTQNTLVQLFTSDASAACNPALAWMTSQKEKNGEAGPWDRFVPVAMHVQAWNVEGYRDSFAGAAYDPMLLAYQRKWGMTSVYAPTVAANGVEWSGWSRGQEPPRDFNGQTGVLTVRGGKGETTYVADFVPEPLLKGRPLTLHAALVAFGLKSKPSEGRNRGRALTHDFIAVVYRSQDLRVSYESLHATVEMARPKTYRGAKIGAVFWVTKKDDVTPLQTVGGYLPDE